MNLDTWVLFIGTTISTIVTVATGYAMLSRSLRKDFDRRFGENDKRLDGIDKRLDGIDRRFDEVNRQFIGVNTRIDQVTGRIDEALRVNNR